MSEKKLKAGDETDSSSFRLGPRKMANDCGEKAKEAEDVTFSATAVYAEDDDDDDDDDDDEDDGHYVSTTNPAQTRALLEKELALHGLEYTDESPPETPPEEKKRRLQALDDLYKDLYENRPECSYELTLKKKLEASEAGYHDESSPIAPYDIHAMCRNEIFAKYFRQVSESDGFDFDEYPGGTMYTSIYPLLEFQRDPDLLKELEDFASLAIKKYFGDDGIERKVNIEKVNAGGCRNFHYYITFKVGDDGKEETFQAKVVSTIEGTIEIPLCRRKVMSV